MILVENSLFDFVCSTDVITYTVRDRLTSWKTFVSIVLLCRSCLMYGCISWIHFQPAASIQWQKHYCYCWSLLLSLSSPIIFIISVSVLLATTCSANRWALEHMICWIPRFNCISGVKFESLPLRRSHYKV